MIRLAPIVLLLLLIGMFLVLFFYRPVKYTKHELILQRTATVEHDLGWIPHSDPDVHNACLECKEEKWNLRSAVSSTVLTPNEWRSMLKHKDKG